MSGLAVRSYVKWAVDPNSFQQAQAQYNGHLSRLQKDGVATTKAANEGILAQHKRFSAQMQQVQDQANAKLKKRTREIASEVARGAKIAQAQASGYTGSILTKAGELHKSYALDAKAYEASLKRMEHANKGFVQRAAAMGHTLQQGQAFDAGGFAGLGAGARGDLIDMQRQHVSLMDKTTDGYHEQVQILRQAETINRRVLRAEKERDVVVAKSNKARMTSERMANRLVNQNIQAYREQLRLQMQINQTLDQMKMHVGQGLVNAFMASSIAIMTFSFRLQGVISTFQDFEKELMNAQSIFQTTQEILFSLSDEIVNFGTRYGISLGTASEGLYTLASAGLSASDSQEVLANTLKLSMAVQGDHDTIAKLTTQTIFGFGLQMSESAELTDKFAHAINMSLIEYQDLASAVKFAMPFFVSTGQNIDQLLGSLQVLTNRALEAGIAGRGLRQALAEFAQHAQDNTAAFRQMGVEIMNVDGSFKLLTEIAREFSEAMGPAASDVDLMTTLLEDLNVRGATAFVHLVQNVDEFEGAVDDLANSAGSATRMADIQQQSLANQIQVVKNALMAPFLLSDKVAMSQGEMNTFSITLKDMVENFENFFVDTMADGTRVLTEQGRVLRDIVIASLREFSVLITEVLEAFTALVNEGEGLNGVLHALFLPVRGLVFMFGLLGENGLQAVLMYKAFNMLVPINTMHILANQAATSMLTLSTTELALAEAQANVVKGQGFAMGSKEEMQKIRRIALEKQLALNTRAATMAQMGANVALFAGMILINKSNPALKTFGYLMLFVAGALTAYSVAMTLAGNQTATFGLGTKFAIASAGVVAAAGGHAMSKALNVPEANIPTMDMGGRIYDTGGPRGMGLGNRHQMVMVEPGETIIPKTQNMLTGGGGITLNIGGDIVTNDADDFAERIAIALPEALRRQNDMGGI